MKRNSKAIEVLSTGESATLQAAVSTERSPAMKKRTDRQPVARAALVVLRDGSCLWFPRATVKRSGTAIRVRAAAGVDVVCPPRARTA